LTDQSLFSPELPKDCNNNLYYDTSILRITILQDKKDFGRKIEESLLKFKGKNQTCYYSIYELKRSLLIPIWDLYMLMDEHRDFQIVYTIISQSYRNRYIKAMIQILGILIDNAMKTDTSPELFLNEIKSIGEEIGRKIDRLIKWCQNNIIRCKLYKPKFAINENIPGNLECKATCNIESFWKKNKSYIQHFFDFDINNSRNHKTKKWHKDMKIYFNELLKDINYGKNQKICPKLADIIILLQASKLKTLVLSSDVSFEAMAEVTSHRVHKLLNTAKYYGGQPHKMAQNYFNNKLQKEKK